MTRKELVLQMIEKLPDDVSYDRVIYHLGVLKGVEIGLEQVARGEVTEHDEFFAQLQAEDAEMQGKLVGTGKRRPKKNPTVHRQEFSKKRAGVHKPAEKARRGA